MLEIDDVPALYQGKQVRWLLSASDKFFPKLNAVSTLSNLVLGITCFLKRNESRVASEKWAFLLAAFGLNVATTVYTLGYMAPFNNSMRDSAKKLEADPSDAAAEKKFRETQVIWKRGANCKTCYFGHAHSFADIQFNSPHYHHDLSRSRFDLHAVSRWKVPGSANVRVL